MLLEVLMQYSCIIPHKPSPLKQRFCNIQIVIITNFVVVSSVGIKRVDCIALHHTCDMYWKYNFCQFVVLLLYSLIFIDVSFILAFFLDRQ